MKTATRSTSRLTKEKPRQPFGAAGISGLTVAVPAQSVKQRELARSSDGLFWEHTFYNRATCGCRVSRRALQDRPEPGQGDGLQVVAEPVHGLRPPLHVLLRPPFRAPLRPPVRRPLRRLDPGEDERRGS